jgi:hypothetical protein
MNEPCRRKERPRGESRRATRRSAVLLAIGAALLASCARVQRAEQPGSLAALPGAHIASGERMLVLPFRERSPLPIYGNHVMCHLTGEHLDAGEVPAGAGREVGLRLFERLEALGVPLVPFDEGAALFAAVDPGTADRYESALGVGLAKGAGASKVVMGVLTRYEERSGTALASGMSAAVSFSVALIDVATGEVVYKLRVAREQAPLSANLFDFSAWWQQGFRWHTRGEIADAALAEAAAALARAAK